MTDTNGVLSGKVAAEARSASPDTPGYGNRALKQAFNYAIKESTVTLTLYTKKNADLTAIKKTPQ